MDRDLVEAKLESLRRCVERIAAKTPSSADHLAQNHDLQNIIAAESSAGRPTFRRSGTLSDCKH
jgi:hypothetical protein